MLRLNALRNVREISTELVQRTTTTTTPPSYANTSTKIRAIEAAAELLMPRSLYMLGFDLDEYLVLPPFKDVFQVILCNKLLTNRTWYQLKFK